MDTIIIPFKNGNRKYQVFLGTGVPSHSQEFNVIARSHVMALDMIGDYCEKNKLKHLYITKDELKKHCNEFQTVDEYAYTQGLTKCGVNCLYVFVEKINEIAITQKPKNPPKNYQNTKNSKIDFLKISFDGYTKTSTIAKYPHKYIEYIDNNDKKLSENFLLFFFGQISQEEYIESWRNVLIGLGLQPTEKGILFLINKIDNKMKPFMFECIFIKHHISPFDAIRIHFYHTFYQTLKEILDGKHIYKINEKDGGWNKNSTLYVYKNKTSCHSRNHEIDCATATFIGKNNSEIQLNVEHCNNCNKFYISYSIYEKYREKHSILLGKIKWDNSYTSNVQDILLSDFSPLKLCGYSVNQQDDYSDSERQYIISQIINNKILKKNEIIRYLEHFINRNGQKSSNVFALKKWEKDLDFTLNYKISSQNKYKLKTIKKY